VSERLQTVHVRVSDTDTGTATPCRIRVTDEAGNYYAPLGRLTAFATGPNQELGGNVLLGMKPWAYIDGTCEIRLPPGPLRLQATKGPEYIPLDQEATLSPGQLSLRLAIQRWTDLRQEGWFSGDTRIHFISPHAALLEAAAEDVAVVNLLATECEVVGPFDKSFTAIPNLLAFSGQSPALAKPGHMVVVNTHNKHPQLGSLGLLNCHRVVYPLSFGGPEGEEDWTLADWCDQCHRKGGLVVWTKPLHETADFQYGEPLADLILGKVDAFEIDFFEDSPFDALPLWYDLLSAGLRVPLVGASGKDSNGIALGTMRTYAHLRLGELLTYKNWIEAVRAGRTFVTNGPLVTLTVNEEEPGSHLELSGPGPVVIKARARSAIPFRQLEVIFNGSVLAAGEAASDGTSPILEVKLPIKESGWLAARCRGDQQVFHRPANQRVFAHTSPIFVRVAGQSFGGVPSAKEKLVSHLRSLLEWARTRTQTSGQSRLVDLVHEALVAFIKT
jgi:hypothetical protein